MDLEVEIAAGKYQGTREISVKGLVHRDFKPGNIFLSDTGSHPTLEGDSDKLCQEHIFYGLLLMACYLDPPMNGEEYREEAKKLRAFLLTRSSCFICTNPPFICYGTQSFLCS